MIFRLNRYQPLYAPDDSIAAPAPAKSEPSLLEAAAGKPKADAPAPDGATAKPESTAKADDKPAPEAAKPDDKKPDETKDAKAPEAKDGDKPKDDAAKPDPAKDATAEIQPPAPVKYEAFKVPEGIKLDDAQIGKFTEIAGAAQVKQETAQALVDLYMEDVQRISNQAVEHARAEQRKVWNTFNDTNKTALRNDPELGGNRLETTLSVAKAFIEEYGGSPEQVQELLAHTTNNGMGNFVGFIRLLNNAGLALNIFEDSLVPANASPPKPTKGPGARGWYDTPKS